MPQQRLTRRLFLGTTAATTGGLLFPGTASLDAAAIAAPPEFPSTDHFWYRPQPEGPFIDAQRDNKAFGYADGKVFLSEDNGQISHEGQAKIAKILRDHIIFSCHDLLTDPPFSRLDLVSADKVFADLDEPACQRIAMMLHYVLNPDGYFCLGAAPSMPPSLSDCPANSTDCLTTPNTGGDGVTKALLLLTRAESTTAPTRSIDRTIVVLRNSLMD